MLIVTANKTDSRPTRAMQRCLEGVKGMDNRNWARPLTGTYSPPSTSSPPISNIKVRLQYDPENLICFKSVERTGGGGGS